MTRQKSQYVIIIVSGVKPESSLNMTHFEISLNIALQTSLVGYIDPWECKLPTKLIVLKENEANVFLRHILLFNRTVHH